MSKFKMCLGVCIALGVALSAAFMADTTPLKGIDYSAIDKSVKPNDDFYHFASGTWLKNNPVPADQSRWGSFDVLADENNKKIRTVIEEVAKDKTAAKGTLRQKLRDFYNLALDSAKADAQGISMIKGDISRISSVATKEDLIVCMAEMGSKGVDNAFGFYVSRDLKNSSKNILYLSQSGLGLPDRDYYLKDDERSVSIRKSYVNHISNMFNLLSYSESNKVAESILALETKIANISMSRVDMRDEEKTYNPKSIGELASMSPAFNWQLYMKTNKIPFSDMIVVNQLDYFSGFSDVFQNTDLATWKDYLIWKYISGFAGQLSSDFVNESFNFNGKILNGTQVMRPRWKRAVSACDGSIGEIVGQLYIQKYFSPDLKVKVNAMVKNILATYKVRITKLDWMSDSTKAKAQEKLAKFNTKLGYPDKWRDYSKLDVKDDSYVLNVQRAEAFGYREMIDKLGKPVDKSEWQMLPHQVNAYYDPTLNEIVFPAAIMQPPFYYPGADDATNYGALGAVIGHEITHGFDDQGCKYDGNGNMLNWWGEKDKIQFDDRAKTLVDCFNKYEALPGAFVNGELTIGENIADLGGLSTAYYALQMANEGKKPLTIQGFTDEQRFFLAFAQVWKQNIKDEMLRKRLLTDVHSPANFRVLGTLSNMTEFYKAFGVKDGDKMYRSDSERAKIW
ncbi:MAG: M13 family metallopeptidase [Bacteroidota bacterium]